MISLDLPTILLGAVILIALTLTIVAAIAGRTRQAGLLAGVAALLGALLSGRAWGKASAKAELPPSEDDPPDARPPTREPIPIDYEKEEALDELLQDDPPDDDPPSDLGAALDAWARSGEDDQP